MKKLFTLAMMSVALPVALMAQSVKPIDGSSADRFGLLPEAASTSENIGTGRNRISEFSRGGGSSIWEETFQNGANTLGDTINTDNGGWVRGSGDGAIWKFSMTPSNGCWSGNTPTPAFTSVSNGFLMFDADSVNCVDPNSNPPLFNQDVLFGSIVSPIIDLSSEPSVALNFEYATRWCCSEQIITVALSSDGGANWSDEMSIVSPDVNINLQDGFSRNVTNLVGGSATVRIRFSWSAASHYYLAIDDISFTVPPSDDIQMNYAYVSHNSTSEEYARVPLDQLLSDITVGAEVFNFGSADQDNVVLDVDFMTGGSSAFTGFDSQPMVATLDTATLEDAPTLSGMAAGLYSGTFTVTSDNDTSGGDNFGNNVLTRNILITDDVYSIDGIGVHDQAETTSLGTNSFTGGEDGFMMLNYYDINSTTNAVGIEVLLATGTQAGSAIRVTLHDTTDIFADDVSLYFAESDLYDVTQQDVNNGSVQLMFIDPVELLPNAYYAGVEMFSNAGDNVVRIVDDITIDQPFYSTMIYIPDDAVYSNGNAAGIRLIASPTSGIGQSEGHAEANLSVYPNPMTGGNSVNLVMRSSFSEKVDWNLTDVTGAIISEGSFNVVSGRNVEQLDMNSLSAGVYLIKVSSNSYYGTEKLVVED